MKVFITGASGYIGSNIVEQLISSGHTVTGLVRSPSSAEKVASLGATAVEGSQTDIELLRQCAADADAAIHCAFNVALIHQGKLAQVFEEDRTVISTICDVFIGTGKTFINSCGTFGNVSEDEFSERKGEGMFGERTLSEKLLFTYADRGVRTINIRQIATAKESGFVGYVGEGANVWPAVHVKDAAALYCSSFDRREGQARIEPQWHCRGGEFQPRRLPEFIAKKMGLETKSIATADATAHWGILAGIVQSGGKITNKYTTEWTGWDPKGITPIAQPSRLIVQLRPEDS
ncbi:NAD-dependent epimerase/dehydratase [Flagelloscypha sp. PMI_526]|nr:NAD-dependent epimerase/dehydratase [Flagelloscypha sp. PMI_526]